MALGAPIYRGLLVHYLEGMRQKKTFPCSRYSFFMYNPDAKRRGHVLKRLFCQPVQQLAIGLLAYVKAAEPEELVWGMCPLIL